MFKHFKIVTTTSVMALALLASAPASSQSNPPAKSAYPSTGNDSDKNKGTMAEMFWTEPRMKMMDRNKDGMVSRQEYMDYTGSQYDRMDGTKKGMLTRSQFMDRKTMSSTFPSSSPD